MTDDGGQTGDWLPGSHGGDAHFLISLTPAVARRARSLGMLLEGWKVWTRARHPVCAFPVASGKRNRIGVGGCRRNWVVNRLKVWLVEVVPNLKVSNAHSTLSFASGKSAGVWLPKPSSLPRLLMRDGSCTRQT